jgi:hypothetical protein
MMIDLHDKIQVAYKKLKQMVYFDKTNLALRERLAEFECDSDFERSLLKLANIIESDDPCGTEKFSDWLRQIRFFLVPKGVENPENGDGSNGTYVSNFTSTKAHRVGKVNYIFDGPIELHLISVLWLMVEGYEYDKILSEHCYGSRLHQQLDKSSDHSAYLFQKYHELYGRWRDTGIEKARDLLIDDKRSVCVIALDVQEYYYRIELDWDSLREKIRRPKLENAFDEWLYDKEVLGEKLFKCIEAICSTYRQKIDPFLRITHSDLPDAAICLPIGLCASPVIANYYLTEFDQAIMEKVRPAYYGRYVDDILIVVPTAKVPRSKDPIKEFMDQVLVKSGVLRWDAKDMRYEIKSRRGLYMQKKKCVLQFFDAEHSIAGLEKFRKQLMENASDFNLLPIDGDESPVAQVAYDLLYDGSANKVRSVKAVAENRWELAGHLAKQTQLHLLTSGKVDKELKQELFYFFKGRNAVDYWDMWERVIGFFIVVGEIKTAESFRVAMQNEINRIQYYGDCDDSDDRIIRSRLRESLERHLDRCMDLSRAVMEEIGESCDYRIAWWRASNLIRHHLVAIPLLNYTGFRGNLTAPGERCRFGLIPQSINLSPRFVHIDECISLVDSGFVKLKRGLSSVEQGNDLYKRFHGALLADVTCEPVPSVEEDKK